MSEVAETQVEQTETTENTTVETKVENTTTETTTEKPQRSILTLNKTEETKTETPEAKFDPATFKMPDKFKGKSAEEIAFSNAQLERKLTEASKKGGTPAVPDQYDFAPLAEHQLQIIDEEHGKEITTMLKETGLTQEQLTKALPHWRKEQERTYNMGKAAAIKEEFGEVPDPAKVTEELRSKWGSEYDSNYKLLSDFYTKNPALIDRPLGWDAKGLEIILELAKRELGADFITDADSSTGANEADLQLELAAIQREMKGKFGPESKALQTKADKIARQIVSLRK